MLMRSKAFTDLMVKINALSHIAVWSSTLDRVAEKYKVPGRQKSWGWHPKAVEIVGKGYAEKMLGPLPDFPVVKHVVSLVGQLPSKKLKTWV